MSFCACYRRPLSYVACLSATPAHWDPQWNGSKASWKATRKSLNLLHSGLSHCLLQTSLKLILTSSSIFTLLEHLSIPQQRRVIQDFDADADDNAEVLWRFSSPDSGTIPNRSLFAGLNTLVHRCDRDCDSAFRDAECSGPPHQL